MLYPIPNTIYQHYKGGTYKILTLATYTQKMATTKKDVWGTNFSFLHFVEDSQTKEPLIVYMNNEFGNVFVSPIAVTENLTRGVFPLSLDVRRSSELVVGVYGVTEVEDSPVVVYQSQSFGDKKVRPLKEWFEDIKVPVKSGSGLSKTHFNTVKRYILLYD